MESRVFTNTKFCQQQREDSLKCSVQSTGCVVVHWDTENSRCGRRRSGYPLQPFMLPPKGHAGSIQVHTMRGEYRAAVLYLANATDKPIEVRLRLEASPGLLCQTT